MLLPRIRKLFRPTNVLPRGNATTSSSLYHPKVRAYPFVAPMDEAIVRLGPYVSYAAAGEGMLGSLGARFLPGFGFKSIQPTQAQAAYLPVWFVDAEVEAKVWLPQRQGAEPSQQTVFAYLADSYVPGLAMDPLSRISFNTSILHTLETVPFTNDLQKQHGSDVLCPPFQFTPFLLPDLAKSLSFQQAVVSKQFRIEPSSVAANLVAAYPVLLPVYLLQYELDPTAHNSGSIPLTIVYDASRPKGPFIMTNIDASYVEFLNRESPGPLVKTFSRLIEGLEFIKYGDSNHDATSFLSIYGFSDVHNASSRRRELKTWLDDHIKAKGALEKYHRIWKERNGDDDAHVDFDDLRIREYLKAERRAIRNWMQHGQVQQSYQKVIETLALIPADDDQPEGSATQIGPVRVEFQHKDQFQERVKAQLEEAKNQREASKPEWLRQWEEQQNPTEKPPPPKEQESEPPSSDS